MLWLVQIVCLTVIDVLEYIIPQLVRPKPKNVHNAPLDIMKSEELLSENLLVLNKCHVVLDNFWKLKEIVKSKCVNLALDNV